MSITDFYAEGILIHSEETCFPRDTARELATEWDSMVTFEVDGCPMGSVEP
ncbi:hypothetical protein AHIS2_p058 [Acaryochloris phage A-HIS2]|nr:hypothetical protein AHIS2_p058 [Acaryochloris phage A-HIS2]